MGTPGIMRRRNVPAGGDSVHPAYLDIISRPAFGGAVFSKPPTQRASRYAEK